MKPVLICLLSLWAVGVCAQTKPDTIGDNGALTNLPRFDKALVEWVGEYYFKGRAGRDSLFSGRDSLLHQLGILRRDLANYYVLKGQFLSTIMTPTILEDSSRRRVPTYTRPATLRGLSDQAPAAWPHAITAHRTEAGWVIENQLQRDTCLTYAFSADSALMALATAHKLTVKRVRDGSVVYQFDRKIANPAYRFSATNALYVVDQLYPSVLNRLDSSGVITRITLPDSLKKRNYRVDQILPDDSLLVLRRVSDGRTLVLISHVSGRQLRPLMTIPLNYLANACHLDAVDKGSWLLAVHRTDKQVYQLVLLSPGPPGSGAQPIPEPIHDYRLDERGNLVALRADSSLVTMNLKTTSPASVIIDTNARYFDWQGDTVVYWKQLSTKAPDRWGLLLYKLGSVPHLGNNPASGFFWYDTDLRRDVPRITLRGNEVHFDDRSNNTRNRVRIDPQRLKPD